MPNAEKSFHKLELMVQAPILAQLTLIVLQWSVVLLGLRLVQLSQEVQLMSYLTENIEWTLS